MSRRRAKARKPAPKPMTDARRNEPLSIDAKRRALADTTLLEPAA